MIHIEHNPRMLFSPVDVISHLCDADEYLKQLETFYESWCNTALDDMQALVLWRLYSRLANELADVTGLLSTALGQPIKIIEIKGEQIADDYQVVASYRIAFREIEHFCESQPPEGFNSQTDRDACWNLVLRLLQVSANAGIRISAYCNIQRLIGTEATVVLGTNKYSSASAKPN